MRQFILATAAIIIISCTSQTEKRLAQIESFIQQYPDSALAAIRDIDTNTLNSKSLKAHYALLHAMALDKNHIDTTDVQVIQPAIQYYDIHGDNVQKARAYYYLGRIQYNAGKAYDAVQSFTVANELLEKTNDVQYKKLVYFSLYLVYARTYDAEEALKYVVKSYDTAKEEGDSLAMWIITERLAECYHNIREDAKADSLFNAYITLPIKDTSIYAKAILQYAKILILKTPPEPEKSIRMFQQSRKIGGQPTLENYYVYAFSLLKTGQRDLAEEIIRQLNDYKISPSQQSTRATWNYRINKYLGNDKEALKFFESTIISQDSILVRTLRHSLSKAQSEYFAEKSSKIDFQRKADILRFALLLSLLIIVLLIVLWCFYKRYQVWKKKYEEIETLNIDISRQLSENMALESGKNQSIIEYRLKYIQAHKKRFKYINDLCAAYLEPSNKNVQQKIYDEIIEGLRALVDNGESSSEAERIVNQEFDDIMKKIRKDCPGHTENTYRLYSFLFMGFSLKTISLILAVSQESVRTGKYRLKKEIESLDTQEKGFFLELLK